MSKRQPKRSVIPEWLSGYSDGEGTEVTMGTPAKLLRLLYCDNAGLRRCRVVPTRRLKEVETSGVGLTMGSMGTHVFGDEVAPQSGLGAWGEVRLVPDMESRCSVPWHPSHDMAIGNLEVSPGVPWELCPRSALKKVLDAVESKYGITFVIGHEIEFYLLEERLLEEPGRKRLPAPIDTSLYCQTSALDGAATLIDDICDAVEACSIPVEQVHSESGPGQFELAAAPGIGIQAADSIIYMREAISSVSQRHGATATFLPKPFQESAGSGGHIHVSMQDSNNQNIMGGILASLQGEGSIGESFMAGMLQHLSAITIFSCPSPNSHARIKPGTWAGAHRVWGVHHKEAAIRLCSGVDTSQTNVEVKCVDSTCNPYLAIAAIIVAGMQGVEGKLRLPAEYKGDASAANDSSVEELPHTLAEAIASYESNQAFQQAMEDAVGTPMCTAFLAVRRRENETAAELSAEELVATLYQRY